jgi:hypothetical protein
VSRLRFDSLRVKLLVLILPPVVATIGLVMLLALQRVGRAERTSSYATALQTATAEQIAANAAELATTARTLAGAVSYFRT